jgi:hypothetical protein
MPNWCQNDFTVYGNEEDIKKFIEDGKKNPRENSDGDWSIGSYRPMPKELEETTSPSPSNADLIAKYGASDWYSWNVKNLGCKWDCSGEIEIDGDYASVSFDSPWSPPLEWFKYIVKKYPTLQFSLAFMETGMWFAGKAQSDGEGGVLLEEGEPIWEDGDGVLWEHNSDKEVYVSEDGEEISEDDAWDSIFPKNPFD